MKKKILALLLSLFGFFPFLSGCEIVQTGDINDYVGTYYCYTAVEKQMNYYWTTTTEISSRSIFPSGAKLKITSDRKVEVIYSGVGQQSSWGKIKVFDGYCKLIDIPGLEDSYKYELTTVGGTNLKGFSYYYKSRNTGVSYDYYTIYVVFAAYIDPCDYSNYVGEYSIDTSRRDTHVRSKSDPTYNNYQGKITNYNSLVGGKLVLNNDYTGKIINNNNQSNDLSCSMTENRLYITDLVQNEPLIPFVLSLSFSYPETSIYLSMSKTIEMPSETNYYTVYTYNFSFKKDIPDKYKYIEK